jgi:hypothetical protein
MKKNLIVLLLTTFISFSYVNAQSWTDWSDWQTTSCFTGVDFRVKSKKTSTGKYEMYVDFRNRYNEDVHFNFDIKGGSYSNANNRITVRANSTKDSWTGASYTSDYFYVNIGKLRFGRDGLQDYASCDN